MGRTADEGEGTLGRDSMLFRTAWVNGCGERKGVTWQTSEVIGKTENVGWERDGMSLVHL